MNSRTDHTAILSTLDSNALAFVTSAYGAPSAPPVKPRFTITSNVSAKDLMTPKAPSTGTKEVTRAPKPCYLPTQGNLSAAAFLVAMRQVGKRAATYIEDVTDLVTGEVYKAGDVRCNPDGCVIMVHDPKAQKDDEAANIAAFCGYDLSLPHGFQLDNAMRIARSTLQSKHDHRGNGQLSGSVLGVDWDRQSTHFTYGAKRHPVTMTHRIAAQQITAGTGHRSTEAHQSKWASAGYVAGIPNALAKLVSDLEGRERLAVSDVITFTNLRAHVNANEQESYTKILAKEFPSTSALRELTNEHGEVVGYEKVEVKNPIAASLHGLTWRGEKMINALASLQALAEARLEAIRTDKTGVDVDAKGAHEFVMRLAEEEMVPCREGEESEIDTIDRNGKPAKISRYEARLQHADRLVSLSLAASDGDKMAQQECFEIACEHTRLSLARRGAPTIEEEVALFGSVPKG